VVVRRWVVKKTYPIYIQETCILFDFIFVSAGQRGLQLKINPEELIKITGQWFAI
jgi:Cys-tRNA(Pro)/Cys-tRNA(Cys) deacylase